MHLISGSELHLSCLWSERWKGLGASPHSRFPQTLLLPVLLLLLLLLVWSCCWWYSCCCCCSARGPSEKPLAAPLLPQELERRTEDDVVRSTRALASCPTEEVRGSFVSSDARATVSRGWESHAC